MKDELFQLNNKELVKKITNLPPNDTKRKNAELILQIRLETAIHKQNLIMSVLTFIMVLFTIFQLAIMFGVISSPPTVVELSTEPVITEIKGFDLVCNNVDSSSFKCNILTSK